MEWKTNRQKKQNLYLVFGGEMLCFDKVEFRDSSKIDLVGIFQDYEFAAAAWKEKAQATVDDAHVRYFLIDIQESLEKIQQKT